MSTHPVQIEHDSALSRFMIRQEGFEAVLQYRRSTQEIDLVSTFVPESLRGRGLAEQLCKAAFEFAKAHKLTVVPTCSYISGAYLKRHPEYAPLAKR